MNALIFLMDTSENLHLIPKIYQTSNKNEFINTLLMCNYKMASCGLIRVDKFKSGDVAEELFDLTNDPSRYNERLEIGTERSVSVGDVIIVNEEMYGCMAVWLWDGQRLKASRCIKNKRTIMKFLLFAVFCLVIYIFMSSFVMMSGMKILGLIAFGIFCGIIFGFVYRRR